MQHIFPNKAMSKTQLSRPIQYISREDKFEESMEGIFWGNISRVTRNEVRKETIFYVRA